MLENLGNYATIALGIAFIIFIHELGHFAVGRFFKFNVEVFSIGFGKPLFKFKRGDVQYQLSWIPLGGYVKFTGELPGEQTEDGEEQEENEDGMRGDPYDFHNRPAYQRALVLVAGVVMNFLSGVAMIIFAFYIGVMEVQPSVGSFEPESPAQKAGLMVGDQITQINAKKVTNFSAIVQEVALSDGSAMDVHYTRDGKEHMAKVTPQEDEEREVFMMGMRPRQTNKINGVGKSPQGEELAPGQKAKLKVGDVITGMRVPEAKEWVAMTYQDDISAFFKSDKVKNYLDADKKNDIEVRYEREGQENTVKVRPFTRPIIGIRPVTKSPSLADKIAGFFGAKPDDVKTVIAEVTPGSAAEKAGLKKGDEITHANKEQVELFKDFSKFVTANKLKEFEVTWDRHEKDGSVKQMKVPITPMNQEYSLQVSYEILRHQTKFGLGELGALVGHSIDRTQYEFSNIARSLKGLVTGTVGAKNMGGPIAIVKISSHALEFGFGFYLVFLAIISFNLALLNILPVPLLDGGHLVLVGIEAIMGRPVNEKVQLGLQYVGLCLIGCLFVFVFYNDIFRAL